MISLREMKEGEAGRVVEIQGGREVKGRLEALGIRVGVRLKKTGQQIMGGPVMVEVGRTQVAVGFGMAGKVFVEL
jgi:ferrous iron transport protein A